MSFGTSLEPHSSIVVVAIQMIPGMVVMPFGTSLGPLVQLLQLSVSSKLSVCPISLESLSKSKMPRHLTFGCIHSHMPRQKPFWITVRINVEGRCFNQFALLHFGKLDVLFFILSLCKPFSVKGHVSLSPPESISGR